MQCRSAIRLSRALRYAGVCPLLSGRSCCLRAAARTAQQVAILDLDPDLDPVHGMLRLSPYTDGVVGMLLGAGLRNFPLRRQGAWDDIEGVSRNREVLLRCLSHAFHLLMACV